MLSRETLWRAQYRLSQIGRRRAGTPRILVVGVCQAGSVAKALRYVLPEAQVDFVSALTLTRRFRHFIDLMAHMDRYDAVFCGMYLPPFPVGGSIDEVRARPNTWLIPTIMFGAYHPDLVHVGQQDGRTLQGLVSGPMGHSHSAVTLYAYRANLSQEQALRLFSEPVFERLGYYTFWDPSVAALLALGREADFELSAPLTRWARRGCFMHSINHVKLYAVADIARGLLAKAGISHAACDLEAFLPDDFASMGSWPVYPEIAGHYGVTGSDLFFKAETPRSGPARTMSREAFVAAAYAYYDRRRREDLVCARVDAWRGDPATVAFLREAAGRGAAAPRSAGQTAPAPAGRLAGHAP